MSSNHRQSNPYLPPHINAELHRRLMELLDSMTGQQRAKYLFDLSVKAGIYTPDGELTEPYKDTSELGTSEPTTVVRGSRRGGPEVKRSSFFEGDPKEWQVERGWEDLRRCRKEPFYTH